MPTDWKTTSCALCAQNCGLRVQVKDNRIVRVRPDPDNPRSRGYLCRKGVKIAYHQHHAERLRHPLKRNGRDFVEVSWEQAIGEIAERLKPIVDTHGPRSFAYMGGGGQGCHFEAGFGTALMKLLGSRYHYNALGQELTGYYWGCGRVLGRQNNFPVPDEHGSDMILAVGWNGMVSHQMPRAPLVLRDFSRSDDKLLAVVDPRLSETARIADVHLALRPGTDALLVRSLIAIILQEGWEDRAYIADHVTGLEQIRSWFTDFDVPGPWRSAGWNTIRSATCAANWGAGGGAATPIWACTWAATPHWSPTCTWSWPPSAVDSVCPEATWFRVGSCPWGRIRMKGIPTSGAPWPRTSLRSSGSTHPT